MSAVKEPRDYPRIQYRPGEELHEQLRQRESSFNSIHQIAKRDVERYYFVVARALERISFTEGEAQLMCDVLNGSLAEPADVLEIHVHASVEDADPAVFDKWDVDRAALLRKLSSLDLLQAAAITDAIERFWAGVSRGEDPHPADVGLTGDPRG
jgi:hypothetical protein